jgi:predicted ATPase
MMGPSTLRVVLTGGPGAGKTTLLQALASLGHAVVGETARAIIKSRLAQGLAPRPDPRAFAEAILAQDTKNFCEHGVAGHVFFDRGVLDGLCMLRQCEPTRHAELVSLAACYRYHPKAFFLPPWEAIFETDAERHQSFAEAVSVHTALADWYRACGYQIVEVPRTSVIERCNFVLQALDAAA